MKRKKVRGWDAMGTGKWQKCQQPEAGMSPVYKVNYL